MDLDPSQFLDLNRLFFESEGPEKYFLGRLRLLALDASGNLPDGDLTVDRFTLHLNDVDQGHEFASIEAVNLLHHCAETSLRLFFALEPPSQCPSLEIARIRGPREFKERVQQYLDAAINERLSRCRSVLATPGQAQVDESMFLGAIESMQALLFFAARRLLGDSNLYNSTKHGLNVRSDDMRIGLDIEPIETEGVGVQGPIHNHPLLRRSGPWLSGYESIRSDSRGRHVWVQTKVAVKLDSVLTEVSYLATLIGSMWAVGKCRFAGETTANVTLPVKDDIQDLLNDEERGVRKVRRELLYTNGGIQTITIEIGLIQ